MKKRNVKDLVDQYITLSFSVTKNAESLIKEQIGSDLTNDQHYTLRYIHQTGPCTSSQLADVFQVNKSAITAIVNRMCQKGLIERDRDPNDRRLVYLSLTEKGKELYFETEQRIHKLVESLITQFEEKEIEQFIKTYEKLNTILIQTKGN